MKKLALLLLCVFLVGCTREPEINYGTVPDFSLIDQSGKPVMLADLRGKVWIADFIFTNCAGTCPMISGTMRRLQNSLPQDVHLVSFSIDPERDTPEVLAKYADEFRADKNRWHFLTGEKEKLHQLSIQGFKLALDETGGTDVEPITHSTRLVLVDKAGKIRGYYGGTEDEEMKRLFKDALKLL
jgi:protein SCO1